MLVIKLLLIILVVLSSLVVGFILSRLTKEELSSGRPYFKLALIFCLLIIIASLDSWFFNIISLSLALSIALTAVYLAIITFISLKRTIDKV